MKVNDFIFRCKLLERHTPGIYRVRTFVNSQSEVYVVLSELDENPSASVTNIIEVLVEKLITQNKIPAESKIFEHYSSNLCFSEEFDLVTFESGMKPDWKSIGFKTVFQFLECPAEEFDDYRTNERVKKEIEEAVLGIPKLRELGYHEHPDVTERRLEIVLNQHSKSDIVKLLNDNPEEYKLNDFLREDLSLIAECYAYPDEEYICFTEFPVGKHRADFALFTGRSRMKVYLIEIKGAAKSLRRKNHYGEFKSEVQEGKGQLLKHSDWCNKNYEEFRKFSYNVLEEVEKGNNPYNAFRGPKYKLCVDSNKDIKLHYILIAGRTVNDIDDSQRRDMEERCVSINMQIETWDSWLNKLTRE